MKRVMTTCLSLAAALGTAFADTPDKFIEYVESDGTQYVNTGIRGRSGTKAEMTFNADTENGTGVYLLSAYGNSTYMNFCYFGNRINVGFGSSSYNTYWSYSRGTTYTLRSEYSLEQKVVAWRNDKSEVTKTGSGGTDSGLDLYAFARNNSGTADGFCRVKLYAMKIRQTDSNGEYQLVRDFQPCMKDGRAGLYDDVSKTIFYGIGGDLIAPPAPLDNTAPDALVDYVESDGTQYIDTGINAQSGTKATAKLVYTESDTATASANYGGYVVLGAKGSTDTSYLYMIRRQWNGGNWRWMTCYGGRFQGLFADMAQDAVYDVTSEITTNGVCRATRNGADGTERDYSGQTENGTVVGPLDTGVNFYAFAANLNGSAGYHAKVRLYSMTISQLSNGVYQVVRDFRPCIKDGVAGLYDEVSKTIFYPAVGKLRAADETVPAKLVEYVESDGTQYVDTGITGKPGIKAEASFEWKEIGGDVCLLGSRASSGTDTRFMPFYSYDSRMDLQYGGWGNNYDGTYEAESNYNASASIFVGSQTLTVNGANVVSLSKTDSIDTGRNMFIFANNIAGSASNPCKARLYGMKIWTCDDDGENASLARDFRPCVATNGIAALYDKVSGTIIYPQGGLLATGGVERAAAVTARWTGGAVASDADLAVAGNWECFDADGNVVEGATPTVATTVLVGQGSALLSLPAGVAVQDWAGVTLTNSVTLAAAGDWSPLGLMTLASGVTVNLNGKNLVSGGFALADGASATVANSGATATLTFAIADGSTATMDNITFASNITFAKTGAGTLANSGFSVGYQTTGSFSLAEGTCKANGTVVIGNGGGGVGTFEQTGGTFDISGYLTMGYLNGAYGTYTMTGGQLFVRNLPLNLGQTATASQPSTLDVSGTAVATFMHGIAMSVYKNGGTSALNVHDGGRIRTSSITKGASENANPTVTFDGGILEPLGNVEGLLDGMPLTVGSKGFIVDTAGFDATFGSITLASGAGPLVKTGAGTLTIAGSPTWSAVVVSNGTLSVAAAITLPSVHLAEGTVLDLGGNTVRCGALTGAGTVTNGTLVVTGTLTVTLDAPVTFADATLDVSGARVELTNPEDITGRDPITVATSTQSITGHARTGVRDRRVQITQSGTGYVLELVWNSGLHLFIR